MGWTKRGNLKGPKGETGPRGPAGPSGTPDYSQVFLAAHPVGSLYRTTRAVDLAATYGGTWRQAESVDGLLYERTA